MLRTVEEEAEVVVEMIFSVRRKANDWQGLILEEWTGQ